MRISQFAPQFSLYDLFRCFWRTTWQTTTSSESLPSSGRALHRWIIIGEICHLHFWCLFADPGGDNLPVHREQEASNLLQNPLGNPQSPLRLLLWGPHTKGWNSYQVNRSSLLHAQLILILVLLLIPILLLIPTLILLLIQDASAFAALRFRLCRIDQSLLLGADQGAAQLASKESNLIFFEQLASRTFSFFSFICWARCK